MFDFANEIKSEIRFIPYKNKKTIFFGSKTVFKMDEKCYELRQIYRTHSGNQP